MSGSKKTENLTPVFVQMNLSTRNASSGQCASTQWPSYWSRSTNWRNWWICFFKGNRTKYWYQGLVTLADFRSTYDRFSDFTHSYQLSNENVKNTKTQDQPQNLSSPQIELKGGDKTLPPASSGDPNYTLMARQRIMSPWLQLRSCSLFSASSSAALVVCVSVIDNKFEYTSFDSFVSANASTAA